MRRHSPSPVPLRAFAISIAALSVPVLGTFALPAWTESDYGLLVWLTALVPAFLLAYYRGSQGVALALAGGMAVLSLTQVVVLLYGAANQNWPLLLGVVVVYLAICIGIATFAEILHRERRAAEQMALVDRLTGLPNRRHAELVLDAEFAAATRGRQLVVVLFDLDRFKVVNDRHGHDAGDEALRTFAEILQANTRRMNLSARFGGEEFISLLADCDVDIAVRFANRVRQRIKATNFPWGRVTVSAGAAAYQKGMGSYEVLVAAADRTLYAAKEAGRDRIEVARELGRRIAPPPPAETAAVASPHPHRRRGAEVVLVVDDERAIRRSLVRILKRAGYRAEESDDPGEVIRRYEDGQDNIDLLITDVMMPKMNGLTLVDRISSFGPHVRVVYMSGYMRGQVSWSGLPGSVIGFLEKPIAKADLLRTVRNVLDEQPPFDVPIQTHETSFIRSKPVTSL